MKRSVFTGHSSSTSIWQSDWSSSDETDTEKKYVRRKKDLVVKIRKDTDNPGPSSPSNANVSSDNNDEQSEKCPICLLPFNKQQVGTPSVCGHCFCLECLLEWSKNINTCPVDRQSFTVIHVRDELGGKVMYQSFMGDVSIRGTFCASLINSTGVEMLNRCASERSLPCIPTLMFATVACPRW